MNENKKGQNTLYAVIGVATLVVAIIGATFAYFSAQATAEGDAITGGTNDVGASLSLTINRVLFGNAADTGESPYGNLVPANIALTDVGIETAVNNKCVANGYTGCHLYKITASSDQTLDAADVLLQDFTVNATDKDAWKFVVFKGTETTEENVTTYDVESIVTGETAQDFDTSTATYNNETAGDVKGYNIHNNAGTSLGMTANTEYVYYLLVYLGNVDDQVQNPEDTNDVYSATGRYSGNVVLNAAGGKVVANFTSAG